MTHPSINNLTITSSDNVRESSSHVNLPKAIPGALQAIQQSAEIESVGPKALSSTGEDNSIDSHIQNQKVDGDRLVANVATNALNKGFFSLNSSKSVLPPVPVVLPQVNQWTDEKAVKLVQDDGMQLRNLSHAQKNHPDLYSGPVCRDKFQH